MKKQCLSLFIVLILISNLSVIDNGNNDSSSKSNDEIRLQENVFENFSNSDVSGLLSNTPRAFTVNHGQLENEEVLFYDQGGSVWFTADGMWMEIREYVEPRGQGGVRVTPQTLNSQNSNNSRIPTPKYKYKRVILKQEFVGANVVQPVGRERLSWNSNFFYGNISEKWCTDVPNYAEVYYENIYNGIDLRYYSNDNGLKYDFIVHPGAKPEQILTRYAGANGLRIDNDGDLVIITEIQDLIDNKPVIFQEYEDHFKKVNGSFIKYNENEIGFSIKDDYDRNTILVIDPLLEYSTLLSESNSGWGGIEVDSLGNAVISGLTNSNTFPVTPGAYDTSYNNDDDIFVTKFNNNGSALIFSTYIGGSTDDFVNNIAIDSQDFTYITGITNSWDYPTTQGAYDTTFSNQRWDVVITKLNPTGSSLGYSTFIHGSDPNGERGRDIFVDSKGCVFVTGSTYSSDFPVTQNAYDSTHDGYEDVFVLKLNYTGAALDYSTFIGTGDSEAGLGIIADSKGNAYVTGGAYSGFPTTLNAYDTTHNGRRDVFVLKLNYNGSRLNFSTFIGGSQNDIGRNILLDRNENIIVTGNTDSTNFPVTNDSFDNTYNGGTRIFGDVFALILNNYGTSLLYSSYIGGSDDEWYVRTTLNSRDEILISGFTNSSDFPVSHNALIKDYSDFNDTFIFHLGRNRSKLLYSTYIGGSGKDVFGDVAIDPSHNIYLFGYTNSPDFPTTPNAYEPKYKGGSQLYAFVMKIFIDRIFNISSVRLLRGNRSVSQIYSKLCQYTLQINVSNTISLSDVNIVRAVISPQGLNIQLIWNRVTNQFSKLNDPNNYLTLEPTSKAYNDSWGKWRVNFNLTFNWTYPDEALQNVQVRAINSSAVSCWHNTSGLFQVENDIVFNGKLLVNGEANRTLLPGALVRAGEIFNWTGPITVYEGTLDVFPPDDEFDISIWNELKSQYLGSCSPPENQTFFFKTITPNTTNLDGLTYRINLTRIPPECDKTDTTFMIKIDGENISYSDSKPDPTIWQKNSEVFTSITITDHGGGYVDNSTIMRCVSNDNGVTWRTWVPVTNFSSARMVTVHDFVTFKDGNDNLIKWRAIDSVGNGPTESDSYSVLVDTQPLFFRNPMPNSSQISIYNNVPVGIKILDNSSGINVSTIKYSTSINGGVTWSSWKTVEGFKNDKSVDVNLNLSFPNGTGNRIKWRASDIAGNGPTESEVYIILIDISKGPELPVVQLLTPENNSKIKSTPLELTWHLISSNTPDIVFDIKLDTQDPPQKYLKQDHPDENLIINISLENYQTYYWTVIPKLNGMNGTCFSGIWGFTMDLPIPQVRLKSPTNNSNISSIKPTFVWAVRYTGPEKLKYHVFIDTSPEFKQDYIRISETHFMPEYDLELGKTYYWQVVPWAGELKGESSEVWRFTVVYSDIPSFKLMLRLEPAILEILPGQTKFVQAFVTNLGNSNDTVRLSVNSSQAVIISGSVYRHDSKEIAPEVTGDFMVMVSAPEDVKAGQDALMVKAISESAGQYGLVVHDEERLIVNIVSSSEPDTKTQTDYLVNWWWILIFLIIIILCIILIILKRKKEESEEEPEESEVEDIGALELLLEGSIISTPELVAGVQDENVIIAGSEPKEAVTKISVVEGELEEEKTEE
jgi:hypothetical protein